MLIIERVVALAAAPVFAGLPDHVLAQVAGIADEVTVERGDLIIEAGRHEAWMFVLVDGRASVIVGEVEVAELVSGDTIGEFAVLDPGPRSATVQATEPSLLLRIEHPSLVDVMVDQPDLAAGIITMLVRRLRAANERSQSRDGAA